MSIEDTIKISVAESFQAALDQMKSLHQSSFLTPEDIANKLQVDASTVRRMCRDGEITYYKFGKFTRISHSDFESYCLKNRIT